MFYHRYEHFFVGAVAEAEYQVDVCGMQRVVGFIARYSDGIHSSMLVVLFLDEHFCVVYALTDVFLRQAVGIVVCPDEQVCPSCKQAVVDCLCRFGCLLASV